MAKRMHAVHLRDARAVTQQVRWPQGIHFLEEAGMRSAIGYTGRSVISTSKSRCNSTGAASRGTNTVSGTTRRDPPAVSSPTPRTGSRTLRELPPPKPPPRVASWVPRLRRRPPCVPCWPESCCCAPWPAGARGAPSRGLRRRGACRGAACGASLAANRGAGGLAGWIAAALAGRRPCRALPAAPLGRRLGRRRDRCARQGADGARSISRCSRAPYRRRSRRSFATSRMESRCARRPIRPPRATCTGTSCCSRRRTPPAA